jgi:lipoprotein NlpI
MVRLGDTPEQESTLKLGWTFLDRCARLQKFSLFNTCATRPSVKTVLSQNPGHVQSHGNLALAYAGLGKKAAAVECFEKALSLDPTYEPAIKNRRITMEMREGEPFIAQGIQQTEYYAERLRA